MARVEADREDLLKEAVALVRRVELQSSPDDDSIIVGFRNTGWLSIYFGPDRMYQFDEAGRLRRAYINGLLYRTQGTALAQLERQRSDTETALIRRDLSESALSAFRAATLAKITWFLDQLSKGSLAVLRQIPSDDVLLIKDIVEFLNAVLNSPQFLAAPIKR